MIQSAALHLCADLRSLCTEEPFVETTIRWELDQAWIDATRFIVEASRLDSFEHGH